MFDERLHFQHIGCFFEAIEAKAFLGVAFDYVELRVYVYFEQHRIQLAVGVITIVLEFFVDEIVED